HEQRTARGDGGGALPGGPSRLARGRARTRRCNRCHGRSRARYGSGRGGTIERRPTVRGPGSRGVSGFHPRRGHGGPGRRDLSSTRRYAVGVGTRGGETALDGGVAVRRVARRPIPPVDVGESGGVATAAHVARGGGVELGSAGRAGAGARAPARRVLRRSRAERGDGGVCR